MPSSKDERGLADRQWARRNPALRKLPTERLRFLAKDFFTAGWTVRDLVAGLDSLPDGRAHGQLVRRAMGSVFGSRWHARSRAQPLGELAT